VQLRRAVGKGVFKNLEGMIEFAQDGIVSKVIAQIEGTEISLFYMAAGQQLSTHTANCARESCLEKKMVIFNLVQHNLKIWV
jgi:hypothetical protein